MSPPAKHPAQVDLAAEERRRRVEAVRGVAGELAQIEKVLLDVQARLPSLLNTVRNARTVIEANTAPASAEPADAVTS